MKEGTITHNIKIPIEITYSIHPAEKESLASPGCPEHIIVELINWPADHEMNALIDSHAAEIKEACDADSRGI